MQNLVRVLATSHNAHLETTGRALFPDAVTVSCSSLSLRCVFRATTLQRLSCALAFGHVIATPDDVIARGRRHLDDETRTTGRLHLCHLLRLDATASARSTCNETPLVCDTRWLRHTTGDEWRQQVTRNKLTQEGDHAKRRRVKLGDRTSQKMCLFWSRQGRLGANDI